MKTKVVIFVNAYAGGAEKMTLNIASFLSDKDYDVIFFIVGKDRGLIANFIPSGSRVEHICVQSYKDGLTQKLIAAIKKERPSFVFSSLMPINWRLCIAAAIFPSVKVIIRVNNYLYTQSFIQKVRLFVAYRFAKHLIVQTDEMRDEHIGVLKLSKEKVITLANPVNIDSINAKIEDTISPFSNAYKNYVFVGRIDPIKGLDVLIRSFALVLKKQTDSQLYIVGETGGIFQDYYNQLVQLAYDLGVTDHVNFCGFSKNPYTFMKFADCLVLPSRNEGLPNVVIESLYLGTPVAVTRSVPVIERIVMDGVNGFLAAVDDVGELASAMLEAVLLGRVSSAYRSATREDFIKLFKL